MRSTIRIEPQVGAPTGMEGFVERPFYPEERLWTDAVEELPARGDQLAELDPGRTASFGSTSELVCGGCSPLRVIRRIVRVYSLCVHRPGHWSVGAGRGLFAGSLGQSVRFRRPGRPSFLRARADLCPVEK